MHGIFWMVIDHSGTCYCGTQPLRYGDARCFLGGNRPLWYMLPWYSSPTVMHGIFWMVIGHSLVQRYSATTVMYGIFYGILYFFGLLSRACGVAMPVSSQNKKITRPRT